ncbi:hypothetical protein D3C84_675240 [compost metagenome]
MATEGGHTVVKRPWRATAIEMLSTSPQMIQRRLTILYRKSVIAKAIGVVARVKGMTEPARKSGLSRELLYRSFSEKGNPTLKTMLAVMHAMSVDMTDRAHVGSRWPRQVWT